VAVVAVTQCTKSKLDTPGLIPAYKRYSASPLFRRWWKLVNPLSIQKMILSAKFGLIYADEPIPNYDYRIQPRDIPRLIDEVVMQLRTAKKVFALVIGDYKTVFIEANKRLGNIEIFPKSATANVIDYMRESTYYAIRIREYINFKAGLEKWMSVGGAET